MVCLNMCLKALVDRIAVEYFSPAFSVICILVSCHELLPLNFAVVIFDKL
jgi:hypothetical protein